jgi:hypothetical protein
LTAETVGRVAGLRARAVAADVDARELHGRRHGEERPHIAAVRDGRELLGLEVLHRARRGGVDDWRLTRDRHRLLQRREGQLDVHVGREAQRDLNPLALDDVEACELEGHRVHTRRHGREAIVAGVGRNPTLLAQQRWRSRRHGHAGQYRALRIRHPPLNRARAAGAAALRERHPGVRQNDPWNQHDKQTPFHHHLPPKVECPQGRVTRHSENKKNRIGHAGDRKMHRFRHRWLAASAYQLRDCVWITAAGAAAGTAADTAATGTAGGRGTRKERPGEQRRTNGPVHACAIS